MPVKPPPLDYRPPRDDAAGRPLWTVCMFALGLLSGIAFAGGAVAWITSWKKEISAPATLLVIWALVLIVGNVCRTFPKLISFGVGLVISVPASALGGCCLILSLV